MNKSALEHSLRFIDTWLTFRYDRETVPGYTVAVAHKGKVVFNKSYGYADLEHKTELTPEHIFRIASHSKTFTATALMQLQEKGKLRIDDYIADYLPWLKQHADKRWQKVTIRQVMSHGAGIIRDGVDSDYWQLGRPFPNEDKLKADILESKLVIDSNTKLKYSNYGYSLLGMLVHAVSGQTYNNYIKKHIVDALGLKNTGPEYSAAIKNKLVIGYTHDNVNKLRLPIDHIDTKSMSAATGFYSTAADICQYFSAQFVGTGKLLDDESKKEMQRVQWHAWTPGQDNHEDYGLGIEIEHLDSRRTIGHGGGFPGHITKSIADPDSELVVVVLTNCLGGPASSISKSIFHILDYFQNNTSTRKPKHDLSKFEGIYMSLWSTTYIVVTGDKVVSIYPNTWWKPFGGTEELEYVDDVTLKSVKTDSFYSEGELVKLNIKNGKVESIVYNGTTMWPEATWVKRLTKAKRIELA